MRHYIDQNYKYIPRSGLVAEKFSFHELDRTTMESITHTLKTCFLLFFGLQLRAYLDIFFFYDILYILAIIWIVYKFYTSYEPVKLPRAPDFSVCIVGAGFSGINMAVKLKEIGVEFRVIEKSDGLGGTWLDNQYPGAACDIPSHLYSFSFEPNPDWSRSFSEQREILHYLQEVARKHGVDRMVEFKKKVLKTEWSETRSKWAVYLDNGEVLEANVVVCGGGVLHAPYVPDFEGKETFRGDAFHSTLWGEESDVSGMRVGVIGTGPTAVQIVPGIAEKVKQLYVFQRSPCWVIPKADYFFPAWVKTIFRIFPFTMFLLRNFIYWTAELRFFTVWRQEGILKHFVAKQLTKNTNTEVNNKRTAEALIPNYEVGCKRVAPSNQYLQAFNRNNVALVTDPIRSFTPDGIRTKDGREIELDTIIYATGFSPIESWNAFNVYGHNASIRDEWQDNPNAYKGITYPGYPNLFFLLGPGTALGHNSVLFMIECQVAYITDAIRKMIESNVKSVDVKRRVNDGYQKWVQECMKNKVFDSPRCSAWYKNERGLNYTLWPSHLTHYWWVTRIFDIENYISKFEDSF